MIVALSPTLSLREREKKMPLSSLPVGDDCKDAGDRATHGAVAES
jgi:hypothetical protein